MFDTFYQWYGQLDPHLRIYWSVALITSALFVIQVALTFIGLGHGDVDADFQAADATPDGGLEGVDGAMQIFTVRNVINFLLGVSWGGVCLWDVIPSRVLLAVVSVFIGLCFVGLFLLLYRQMMRLQASGNIRRSICAFLRAAAVRARCRFPFQAPCRRWLPRPTASLWLPAPAYVSCPLSIHTRYSSPPFNSNL